MNPKRKNEVSSSHIISNNILVLFIWKVWYKDKAVGLNQEAIVPLRRYLVMAGGIFGLSPTTEVEGATGI